VLREDLVEVADRLVQVERDDEAQRFHGPLPRSIQPAKTVAATRR
jgi:hypothetical protein